MAIVATRYDGEGVEPQDWSPPETFVHSIEAMPGWHTTLGAVAMESTTLFMALAEEQPQGNWVQLFSGGPNDSSTHVVFGVEGGYWYGSVPPEPAVAVWADGGVFAWVHTPDLSTAVVRASAVFPPEVYPEESMLWGPDFVIDVDETGRSSKLVLSADETNKVVAIWAHDLAELDKRQIVTNRHDGAWQGATVLAADVRSTSFAAGPSGELWAAWTEADRTMARHYSPSFGWEPAQTIANTEFESISIFATGPGRALATLGSASAAACAVSHSTFSCESGWSPPSSPDGMLVTAASSNDRGDAFVIGRHCDAPGLYVRRANDSTLVELDPGVTSDEVVAVAPDGRALVAWGRPLAGEVVARWLR
jgi:hypothetical protein